MKTLKRLQKFLKIRLNYKRYKDTKIQKIQKIKLALLDLHKDYLTGTTHFSHISLWILMELISLKLQKEQPEVFGRKSFHGTVVKTLNKTSSRYSFFTH